MYQNFGSLLRMSQSTHWIDTREIFKLCLGLAKSWMEVAMVMFMFKLITGRIDAPNLLNKWYFCTNTHTYARNRVPKMSNIQYHRTNYGRYEPTNYVCILFFADLNLSAGINRHNLLSVKVIPRTYLLVKKIPIQFPPPRVEVFWRTNSSTYLLNRAI